MAKDFDPDLPDALRDEEGGASSDSVERQDRLDALGQAIAKKRDEAVNARRDSGIEAVWTAAEEAYLCIDDMNRHEFIGAKWIKPMTMTGPVQAVQGTPDPARSTAFVRLTSRYVDMAAARISEIVLPIDEKAFSFKPTPVAEPINPLPPMAATPAQMGMPMQGAAQPMPGMAPPAQPPQPTDPAAVAKDAMTQHAEAAETRIYDWMTESKYPAQMRRVIKDAARIGVGILKGPYPDTRTRRAITKKNGVVDIQRQTKVVPAYKRVDPWCFYPHKACGEDIHSGDYVVELDHLSTVTLKGLKAKKDVVTGSPIYIGEAIDAALQEGPEGHQDQGSTTGLQTTDKSRYRVWYFTGVVSREDMLASGSSKDDLPAELTDIPAIVTLVNDRVIRASVNPDPAGKFGYHAMSWSPRDGSWAGVGVGEQVSMAQKTVNGSVRAVFNNAGISAGVQIVLDRGSIIPADGKWTLTPNKLWFKTSDGAFDDIRKAFTAIEIPNITAQLLPIVELGYRMAEEASNIPLISQGQTGPQDPQTFGQAELQNSNANALLRSVAYTIDDCITEPVVDSSYEWLLLDPDVPDEEKGDWQINARGSIAMVEKAIQEQTLMQMGGLVVNPAFGASPARWFEEVLKSKRMDPRKILLSDEEKAAAANQQPPEAPQVTAANINAQARIQAAQIGAQVMQTRITTDTDRDAAYVHAETERTRQEGEARMAELQVKRELAMLDYANKREVSLEQVKASLAETAMKLQVQKDLSLANHVANRASAERDRATAPQVATPPNEPAGRAPAGQAFEA